MMTLLVCSCTNESSEVANEKITEADIFVASEAFQQYQSEMRKDSKMMHGIVKKLSKADKKAFVSLLRQMKSTKDLEGRKKLMNEISGIIKIDYSDRISKLLTLSEDVFKDKSFSNKDLISAIQRHNIKSGGIVNPQDFYSEQAYWECRDYCYNTYMVAILQCDHAYPGWENMAMRSSCYSDAALELDICYDECENYIL